MTREVVPTRIQPSTVHSPEVARLVKPVASALGLVALYSTRTDDEPNLNCAVSSTAPFCRSHVTPGTSSVVVEDSSAPSKWASSTVAPVGAGTGITYPSTSSGA